MAANSDTKVASQKAAKAYSDSILSGKLSTAVLEAPNGICIVDPDNSKKLLIKSGLRVLIPDGRNADGSFKSVDVTLTADTNNENNFSSAADRVYGIYDDGTTVTVSFTNTLSQEATPNASTFQTYWWYKPSANYWYNSNGSTWTARAVALLGRFITDSSGDVTSITTFTDGAVDRILTSRDIPLLFAENNQLLDINGYQKLPGGIILQWATASVGLNSYPITFPNEVLSIMGTDNDGDNINAVNVVNTSTSQYTTYSNDTGTVRIFAVGY
jgi:hypothetical protein